MAEAPAAPTPEDGGVYRDQIIAVLKMACEHGNYTIDIQKDGAVILFKDSIPEVYELPQIVGRRMIARLSHKYNIQPEWFYHPHMLIPGNSGKC